MNVNDSEPRDAGQTPASTDVDESRATRFCSSCSRTKPVKGGGLVRCANGAKRWKCADCIARSRAHMASLQSAKGKPSQDQT